MAEPIPYTVKTGDTYSSIAKKLGLKDWSKLKSYHNEHAGFNHQVGNTLYANTELLTPPPEDVAILNGDAQAPKDEVKEEQQQEEQKQQEEKKKQEEEKKQEQVAKGEHDGKYFVVHGAKCVCDKAENPKQTADLQVTSHNIIVLNDQSKKYLATEEDKTFIPPAATFGKCTLKPSSGGYLPCALAPAPKWNKAYESTQVKGKKSLTEISELLCTMGGKITINKHGQTDSVTTVHADNTNPLELAMVNPAVEQPKKKADYPSVSSISINQIENRQNFKPKNSKTDKADYPVIYLRKGEEAKFEAQLSKGNKQLTSWVVYNDHKGSKESRILVKEQVGTEFLQSFEQYGKYRVEAYGKPKSQDFEKGKYNKCDPSCSIDIEVLENLLYDLEINDFKTPHFNRTDSHKKIKFRQNFPAEFKAKFHILPSEKEKSHLKIYVLDGAGNILTDALQTGTDLVFTPRNSNAKYTIVAEYITETGEKIIKQISGEAESNTVVSITHSAEVIRPNTSLMFQINKMRYPLLDEDTVSNQEINEIKWNLNGIQIGTGRSITIPGNMFLTPQKYVIEAFCKMANAFGSKAKHEEDDWHFEVKENDVVSFSLSGIPKVGKPVTAKVDKMIFPDLLGNETIYWQAPFMNGTGQSITTTPRVAGTFPVKCSINNRKGISQNVTVVEAKITEGFWNDFGGSEVSRARWGQTVDYCIKGENIEGEKIELHIYDDDNPPNDDDFAYSNTENNKVIVGTNNKGYTFHSIELNDTIKDRTTNITSDEVKLYAKAKLIGFNTSLTDVTEKKDTQKHLTVNNEEEVYRAIIGDKDGRARHNPVDYDIISWVYANTTYPKDTKLKVKIFENTPWYEFDQKCDELEATGTIKEDGTLVTEINWSKLKDAKQNKKTKNYYAKIYNEDDDELLDGKDSDTLCSTVLTPQSDLLKEASYVGAVTVGSQNIQQPSNENGVCECEAKVKAFMRMLRVKEGSEGEKGYTTLFTNKDFTKPPYNRDMSTHPKIVITAGGYSSSATGAYQIMQDTFKGFQGYYLDKNKNWQYSEKLNYIKQYKINSFDQESQDKLCIVIFKHNYVGKRAHSFFYKEDGTPRAGRAKFNNAYGDIVQMIIDDDFDKAILTSSLCWASLPDAPYGQPTGTKAECKANYEKFLKEELAGKSDLHLKKGFLKDFGYGCCGESTISQPQNNDGKWRDPVDNPMCTIFTQSQTNGIINLAGKHWGLFGTNARNGTRPHKGLDLFVIPGSSVYSCVKAEVTNIVYPAAVGYGISLTLKVLDKETFLAHKRDYQLKYPDKEDKKDSGYNEDGDIYLFYGHLRKVLVNRGDVIDDVSKPIALSGVSGVQSGGTCAPHVHFEIRDASKRRCNPGYYVYYKSYDDQSQIERDIQIKTAQNGKINEFGGKE